MARRSRDARSDRTSDAAGSRQRIDRDGLKISESPGRRKLLWAIAGLLGSVLIVLAIRGIGHEDPEPIARANVSGSVSSPTPADRATSRPVPVRRPAAPLVDGSGLIAEPDESVSEVEDESTPDPDFTLPLPGAEPSGIALFPKPGTDPPKIGVVVPDDFELPPGFMRHYQATDDGQELAPILMFHPDFDFVDESGAPIELPDSRVVPPELAPTGLEIELLELPEPLPDDAP